MNLIKMRKYLNVIALVVIPIWGIGQSCPSNWNTTLTAPQFRSCNLNYAQTIIYDEFNGSSVNSSIWGIRTGCVRNTDVEAQHYKNSSNNVSVSNGTLKLTARKETTWDWVNPPPNVVGDPTWETRDYTSGEIYTLNDSLHFGEYTIRCRYPIGSGVQAAFWLFGRESNQSNEIDFWEQDRSEEAGKKIENVTHWYVGGTTCRFKGSHILNTINDWHTYKCIWTPYELKFFCDDMVNPDFVISRYLYNGNYVSIDDINEVNTYTVQAKYPIYHGGVITNFALYNGISIDDSKFPPTI